MSSRAHSIAGLFDGEVPPAQQLALEPSVPELSERGPRFDGGTEFSAPTAFRASPITGTKFNGAFLIESQRPLSTSLIWKIQRDYYCDQGIDAWDSRGVPNYVTSNPTIAAAYARLAYAYIRDRKNLGASSEPQLIVELGTGHGQFSFHFLRSLVELYNRDGAVPDFVYVMTDLAENNLAHLQHHPQLRRFMEMGVLDLAFFDAARSQTFELRNSGRVIGPGDAFSPPLIIANYVFDSIEYELIYVEDQRLHQCLVTTTVDEDPATMDTGSIMEHIQCSIEIGPVSDISREEAWYVAILENYRMHLNRVFALVPIGALDCLKRLRALSPAGAVVLSADKGYHEFSAYEAPPEIVQHGGCFSFSVDFHALGQFCSSAGGGWFAPAHQAKTIDVIVLLAVDAVEEYRLLRQTYDEVITEFGPDDFYSLFSSALARSDSANLDEIVAFLRLSRYDCRPLRGYLSRLAILAESFGESERAMLVDVLQHCFASYYQLGDEQDLAFSLGCLCYALLDDVAAAAYFFEQSLSLCGLRAGTIYNRAICAGLLGEPEREALLLARAAQLDPSHDLTQKRLQETRQAQATFPNNG